MIFFNTLRFHIDLGISIAIYFGLLRLFPKLNRLYPLLALSLYFTHHFFKVPLLLLAITLPFMIAYYYLTLLQRRSLNGALIAPALLGIVGLLWLYVRFPETVKFLGLAETQSIPQVRELLPYFIGAPFMVCRLVSFLFDIRNKEIKHPTLISFLVYIFYFPTLLSGPVTKFREFTKEHDYSSTKQYFHQYLIPGTKRIVIGILKREVLTQLLSTVALPFIFIDRSNRWQLILGAYLYYIYLYLDFSGYSDLAIGLSKILAIGIPENFNWPIFSRNPVMFWQRWHTSFLNWLNEYLLSPLYTFLLRAFPNAPLFLLSCIAIFTTFFFTGFWHGESLRYVFYGILNATVMVLYRSYDTGMRLYASDLRQKLRESMVAKIISCILCFHYVTFGLMVFSLDFKTIKLVLYRIFHG